MTPRRYPAPVGLLTDGGYILYDDMPGKLAIWRAYASFASLPWDEFRVRFKPFRDRAMVEAAYGIADAMRDLAASLGLGDRWDEIERARQPASREARPGVVETLRRLRARGIPVIVVSDSMDGADRLAEKYDQTLGLRGLLAGIVSSRDVGAQKPDPRFWVAALAKLADVRAAPVDPAEVVFVGHDVEEITGAWEFGLRAVACYYNGPALPFLAREEVLLEFSDVMRLFEVDGSGTGTGGGAGRIGG